MNSPIEEIKARLNIVDVIQGYIRLQKAGINYKAACPFHGEKTPSFFVSPTRQIWHCFGCGRGGDHFKFIMEIEGHDFPEALRLLAGRAGVILKREDPRLRSERNRLYDICETAAEFFEKNLSVTPAVLRYVGARGILPATAKEFRIGFAPKSWDTLLKFLQGQGFRVDETEKAGLAIRSEDKNSWYDRFRGRIMFPIFDAASRVIGFGGRIFDAADTRGHQDRGQAQNEAKYVNTPNTLIYDKSKVLYGFDKAKQDIRVAGQAVVVEGYMDCVMSHQAGVKNTIAVSGTAFTPQQLGMIKRLADTLVFSFDSDAAGESATKRSLALATEFEFERKIIEIPAGKDPADAVLENPESWRTAVAGALPVVEFYYRKAFARFDPKTPEGKKEITALLIPLVVELRDEIQKAHWIEKISASLSVPREAVEKELMRRTPGSTAPAQAPGVAPESVPTRRDILEERLLALLTVVAHDIQDSFGDSPYLSFTASQNAEIFAILRAGAERPMPEHLAPYYSMLRFKGEILKEITDSPVAEFRVSWRELEKECVRDRLFTIKGEIELLEKTGKHGDVLPLLADFKTLSLHLKTIQ
ncbi:DNA primase [Candidatus Kaiserbacteria bacterium RIFCSPLOWO2_02_FULL_55_12]|uniref:DNA primase n=1 Tax=Candidatus Kaiserbacteria bacterium RIFCSPLOWO2_02_FULL_55_12 TaxID=1798522 RepID=A0A1F6F0C7_9BACT|nr:MAG: DNA primase [Candidatus Kaiserbacteria bacterium RIFCSPLOWO2_02_FULL_55_12]